MNKDFADFQKHFKYYQNLFGLNGYKVYFKHEPIDNGFADITITQRDMIATVRLDSSGKDKQFKHIKESARHEALHLLIGRLEFNGHYRYIVQDEICEAAEELVIRLEGLIEK